MTSSLSKDSCVFVVIGGPGAGNHIVFTAQADGNLCRYVELTRLVLLRLACCLVVLALLLTQPDMISVRGALVVA